MRPSDLFNPILVRRHLDIEVAPGGYRGGGGHHQQKSWQHHGDVIKRKHFPRCWPFVWGIHRSSVNFHHKGQWRGALMFSLICAWTNGWVNNRDAGDLRRHHAHYGVTGMQNKYDLVYHEAGFVISVLIESANMCLYFLKWVKVRAICKVISLCFILLFLTGVSFNFYPRPVLAFGYCRCLGPSVRPSVRPSARPYVRPSPSLSVR